MFVNSDISPKKYPILHKEHNPSTNPCVKKVICKKAKL